MFLTGVIPFLSLTLPMICGLLITIISIEVNNSWAFMTYIAVSLLSIIVTFDKEAALSFILIFGHYPIFMNKVKKIPVKILRILIKFIVCNICIVLYYQLTIHLLGIEDFMDDFAILGKYAIYILWAISNIFFALYDYILNGCCEIYIKKLKSKIFKGSFKN